MWVPSGSQVGPKWVLGGMTAPGEKTNLKQKQPSFTTHHHANAQNTAMYTFTQTVCPFLYHAHGVKHVRTALIDTDPESPYPRSTTVLNLHGFRPGSGLG